MRIVDQSPMGAGSGTSSRFAPDRRETANRLGFASPIENVVDAVSAVDFLIVSASAIGSVSTAIDRFLREIQQLNSLRRMPLYLLDDQIERLPDLPQLRIHASARIAVCNRRRTVRQLAARARASRSTQRPDHKRNSTGR